MGYLVPCQAVKILWPEPGPISQLDAIGPTSWQLTKESVQVRNEVAKTPHVPAPPVRTAVPAAIEERGREPGVAKGSADVSEITDMGAEPMYENQRADRAAARGEVLDVQLDAIRRGEALFGARVGHGDHGQGIYTLRPVCRTVP